jgi:hypothetical protein
MRTFILLQAAAPLTMICNTTILPEWSCLYQECRQRQVSKWLKLYRISLKSRSNRVQGRVEWPVDDQQVICLMRVGEFRCWFKLELAASEVRSGVSLVILFYFISWEGIDIISLICTFHLLWCQIVIWKKSGRSKERPLLFVGRFATWVHGTHSNSIGYNSIGYEYMGCTVWFGWLYKSIPSANFISVSSSLNISPYKQGWWYNNINLIRTER